MVTGRTAWQWAQGIRMLVSMNMIVYLNKLVYMNMIVLWAQGTRMLIYMIGLWVQWSRPTARNRLGRHQT